MTIISNLMINILYLNYCFKGTVFWKTKFVWYIISLLFLNIDLWGQKPTVIISTDPIELNEKYRFVDEDIYAEDPETGDPDDMQSLVRLLLYSYEFQIEGIIASSERIDDDQRKIWVNRDYSIFRMLNKYEEVEENLRSHSPYFPTADELKEKVRKGYSHQTGSTLPGPGRDSPGSDLIIQVVDASNGPVWFLDWVGQEQQFELPQALWKVKQERSPEELNKFVSKLRVASIAISKEGPGAWLRDNFPQLFLIGTNYIINSKASFTRNFFGLGPGRMEGADSAVWNLEWADKHVRKEHGALGALFPSHTNHKRPGVSDYDSRTFFHLIPNGLGEASDPAQGSWGGRYFRVKGKNHWAPAEDNHPASSETDQRIYFSVGRYQYAIQADFQARMDWCVQNYEKANHNPIAAVNGDLSKKTIRIEAYPGKTIFLRASGSCDPDGDALNFQWWQYNEAGTFPGNIEIINSHKKHASLNMPNAKPGQTMHIILEVTDNGSPALTSYRRIILTAK